MTIGYVDLRKTGSALKSSNLSREASFASPSLEKNCQDCKDLFYLMKFNFLGFMRSIFATVGLFSCSLCVAQEPCCSSNILDTFYPSLTCGNNLWINADLLFWTPRENSVVLTNRKTNLFISNDVTLEPALSTHFKWDFGSRVGFGYIFCEDKWDVSVNWTYYTSSTRKRSSNRMEISEGMFPIWSLADDIIAYDWVANGKMHWTLNLNLLDIDFGRNFCWKIFYFRPFAGLRSAWIDQHFNVYYGGGIFANGPDLYAMSNNAGFDQMHMSNNYWGIGPQLGIEPQMNLGRGWRIYGSASGSLECGFFRLEQKETYLMKTRYYNSRDPFAFRWIFDAAGGFLWETFLCEDRYAFAFKLGWEYHQFFRQFELKKDQFGLVPAGRNLTLKGVIFSGRFDF